MSDTTPAVERDFVLNIVWTGTVFTYLQYFVASQLAQSDARFRFVVNGCPREQLTEMDTFAARHPERIVEILEVSEEMVAHGVALDRVRERRDDGRWFCTIDPDIKANSPFVTELAAPLVQGCAAVTSGKEVWSDDNLVPEGHIGVAGEHFFDRNGFVFGSPHLALYERRTLDETAERWGAGLGSAGPELSDAARARMADLGHEYKVYDTAKIINALLQADGHRLVHRDLDQLVHIGGMSHYLSPAYHIELDDGEVAPEWARWGLTDRYHVAKFTALTLKRLLKGEDVPSIPRGLDEPIADKLRIVQREMSDLFSTYGQADHQPQTLGDPHPKLT